MVPAVAFSPNIESAEKQHASARATMLPVLPPAHGSANVRPRRAELGFGGWPREFDPDTSR